MTCVRRGLWSLLLLGSAAFGSTACGDLVGSAALPAGTEGPNTYNTEAGALGMYRGVKADLSAAIQATILVTGQLTDELMANTVGVSPASIGATGTFVDERIINENSASDMGAYRSLQRVRGDAVEAAGLFANYAPRLSPALRGEMYAAEGYAELLLAEVYCSGVPLSTLDFQGDFTYKPSSTSDEVYAHAQALFDSALAISSDSATAMAFAQVGKGRVLLDRGKYAEAGLAVASVPTSFQYTVPVNWSLTFDMAFGAGGSVASHEGKNGLPFSTGDDPRIQVTAKGTNQFGVPLFAPAQYPPQTAPVVLASGIEARLIEAEAALYTDPNSSHWLATLNALRTSCPTLAGCPTPAPAGTSGVSGLPPLSDPGAIGGSDSARVTLLMTERAYWLFLTGHRQGDLRRLVRNYGRPQQTVYPTGVYFGGYGFYGTDVNIPIPFANEQPNPLYHGCLTRGA